MIVKYPIATILNLLKITDKRFETNIKMGWIIDTVMVIQNYSTKLLNSLALRFTKPFPPEKNVYFE